MGSFQKGVFVWSNFGRSAYVTAWRHRLNIPNDVWKKGADAVLRALRSSWWEWLDGSAPFFWRWPEWYRDFIRDGIAFPLKSIPPAYMVPQQDEKNIGMKHKMIEKLSKVVARRYLEKG